jgi:phosphoheptose isomerase
MGVERPAAGASAWAAAHLADLMTALDGIGPGLAVVEGWGAALARRLAAGGRLLVCGNGGSAALSEHLAAELVGRFAVDRPGLSAIALSTDGSVLTAVLNDFAAKVVFARQVEAHGRLGDVLLLISTSGRSPDLLQAVVTARAHGLTTWAMTGPAPNPLSTLCDEVVAVPAPAPSTTVQEVHQMLVHVLAHAVDVALAPEKKREPA